MIARLFILTLLVSNVSYSQEYDYVKNSAITITSELPSLADDDPIRANPQYQRANQFVSEMKYYAAITVYDSLFLGNERNKHLLLGRGLCYKKIEKYDLAMKDYNTLLEIDSSNAAAWSNRGMLHMAMGNLDLALSDYNKSIDLAPEEAGMYYNRFWVYFYNDDLELACKDLERAIQLGFGENFGPEAQELRDYYCKKK